MNWLIVVLLALSLIPPLPVSASPCTWKVTRQGPRQAVLELDNPPAAIWQYDGVPTGNLGWHYVFDLGEREVVMVSDIEGPVAFAAVLESGEQCRVQL